MIDPELYERFRALRRRPKLRAELRAHAEAAVRTTAFATGEALWIPRPPLPPPPNQAPPAPLNRAPSRADKLAGLDEDGRVVLVRSATTSEGRPLPPVVRAQGEAVDEVLHSRVLRWEGDRLEVIGFLTGDGVSHVTWIDHDAAGRPVRWQTAGVEYNDLGRGWSLAWCTWDGDRPVEVRRLEEGGAERRHVARYDEHGLVEVRETASDVAEWRRDLDAYEPEPLALDTALGLVVADVADGAWDVFHAVGDDAWAVRVHWEYGEVFVATRADALRAGCRLTPEDVVWRVTSRRASIPRSQAADVLRARRSLRQLRHPQLGGDWATTLQRRLSAQAWPDDVAIFVVAEDGSQGMVERARTVDAGRVERAFAALPSPTPVPDPERGRLRDRDDLRRRLAGAGLPTTLADEARWGLAILPGGAGASRLGGPALVPPGAGWPQGDGRWLTHLASIDLAELPDHPDRTDVPAAGVVALFLDMSDDVVPIEDVVLGDDERVVLLVTPPEATPDELPPPTLSDDDDPPTALRERRVRFEPVLTAPPEPQLEPGDADAYETLYAAVEAHTPGLAEPSHLIGGLPLPVQWNLVEPGETSLLNLAWDETIGFEYLDGGSITVLGPSADVAAGRYTGLRVEIESG